MYVLQNGWESQNGTIWIKQRPNYQIKTKTTIFMKPQQLETYCEELSCSEYFEHWKKHRRDISLSIPLKIRPTLGKNNIVDSLNISERNNDFDFNKCFMQGWITSIINTSTDDPLYWEGTELHWEVCPLLTTL